MRCTLKLKPGLHAIMSVLLLCLLAGPLLAQSSKVLSSLKTETDALLSTQPKIAAEIEKIKARQLRNQQELAKAEKDLEESHIAMSSAFEKAQDAEDDRAHREATRLSISYNRNNKRVERFNKRAESYQAQLTTLNKQLKDNQNQVDKNRKEIAALKQAQKEQKAAQHKAAQRKLEKPKAEKPEVKKEAGKPTVKKPPIVVPSTTVKTTKIAAQWPNGMQATPTEIAFAKARLAAAKNDTGSASLNRVQLKSRTLGNHRLRYLGNNLYGAVIEPSNGQHKIRIFTDDFWATIKDTPKDTDYQFIYDATSLSKPKLFYFSHGLITP